MVGACEQSCLCECCLGIHVLSACLNSAPLNKLDRECEMHVKLDQSQSAESQQQRNDWMCRFLASAASVIRLLCTQGIEMRPDGSEQTSRTQRSHQNRQTTRNWYMYALNAQPRKRSRKIGTVCTQSICPNTYTQHTHTAETTPSASHSTSPHTV
jgi:hypothetical protein